MSGNPIAGYDGNTNRTPMPFLDFDPEGAQKMPHDSYEVFVNEHFVGRKIVLAQNEDVFDVEDFLNDRGFHKFTTKLDGDRFFIQTDNTFQEQKMRENLEVYLQIR
jgi:hypothetical protein